jgi:hypothetical protein
MPAANPVDAIIIRAISFVHQKPDSKKLVPPERFTMPAQCNIVHSSVTIAIPSSTGKQEDELNMDANFISILIIAKKMG